MIQSSSFFISFSSLCGILACIGDFSVTFILGAFYPKYHFLYQSESFLGTSDSPVADYMNSWGYIFCILLVIFAFGLKKVLEDKDQWSSLAVWLIIIYGTCEGAGSGLFPYEHLVGELTFIGKLHSLCSGTGVFALATLPFATAKVFSKESFQKFITYSQIVFVSGLILILLFLVSGKDPLPYRGLMQRIFLLNYYIFLVVLAIVMVKKSQNQDKNIQN